MKYFRKYNTEKKVMLFVFIGLFLGIWVFLLPTRSTILPGAEVFLLPIPFIINLLPEKVHLFKVSYREFDDWLVIWLNKHF